MAKDSSAINLSFPAGSITVEGSTEFVQQAQNALRDIIQQQVSQVLAQPSAQLRFTGIVPQPTPEEVPDKG